MPSICSSCQASRSFVSGSPSHQKNGTMPIARRRIPESRQHIEIRRAVGETDGPGRRRIPLERVAERKIACPHGGAQTMTPTTTAAVRR